VVLVSALSSWQVTNYLDEANARALSDDTDLFARLLENGNLTVDPSGTNDATLRGVAHALRVRLSIIGSDGHLLFDSSMPRDSLAKSANHGDRTEVLSARQGGVGLATRKSTTTGEEYRYAARMLNRTADPALTNGFVRVAMNLGELRTVASYVRLTIWTIGLGITALIVLLSLRVARRITKPILDIASTAQAIRDGDLGKRVTVSTNDEIASLATSVNEMAERLSSDIERLTKLEHVRSQFLGNVSHELRTPIFSIQGFLETLQDGAVDDPQVNRQFLDRAHSQALRLNTLLNDLIEISRIESGEMKMSFRYFDLREFLEQMAEEMRPHAEACDLSFTLESQLTGDVMALGDRDRLRQVITNLVNNAVKYTEPGGSVTLRGMIAENRCRIEVQDTGCGIPAEHLDRIFERFYRVDKGRSRDVGGTGLGLAIVKHIVEAHGGTIGVTSKVGVGSTFFFSLKR
jgi:two-component system phosphate regulon sensor histidine kinase PhoR